MSEFTILDKEILYQNFAGLVRSITPLGGGLIREYADQIAATTGNIEIGMSYNCGVDSAGVWQGRDVTGPCWLEKWLDDGQNLQFWYAASAAAGTVPAWSSTISFGVAGGIIDLNYIRPSYYLTKSPARAYVTTAALAAYVTPASTTEAVITSPAAAITVTLPAPISSLDGIRVRYVFGAATTVTWAVTAPATATAGLKTAFTAGDSYEVLYNAVAGSPAGSPATTWIPY